MSTIHESERLEQALQQLTSLIRHHAPIHGAHETVVPSLTLMHATEVQEPIETTYKPSICVVAQGAKTATLAGETFRYDPLHYLITSVELPITGRVIEASPELPYLSLKLDFDTEVILDIVQKMNWTPPVPTASCLGITVNKTSPALLESLVRLMRLLHTPEDVPILAPLVIREILYRVLQGEPGSLLRQFAVIGSHAYHIALAIQRINRHFDTPLAIEELAESVHMSPSAFHKHFKRVTAMSPLQYQKTVRLQEARRLMLAQTLQASEAAFRVGYESASQFSREYARMFGRPPLLDMQKLRGSLAGSERPG